MSDEERGRYSRSARTTQTLRLDGFPTPSQVRILGPNGTSASPYTVNAVREALHRRVKIETMLQQTRPVPAPAAVTLRYVFPVRRQRDVDNFTTIGKAIVDGLVRAEILDGDDAERLRLYVQIAVDPGAAGPRLDVLLEPASE